MTTTQVLSNAYAEIFGIPVNEHGNYYGQMVGNSEIDYANFNRYEKNYDPDADYIEACTETGSEGVWIGCFLVHWDFEPSKSSRERVGTIKTLDEGRDAWRNMGALAGELAYMSGQIAWKLYKAEQKAQ